MSFSEQSTLLDLGQTVRGLVSGQHVFGRYQLKKIAGRGGMGVVWCAFDEVLERDVALKFLPELVAVDPQAIANLKRETIRSQQLRHHHIVHVYDFVRDGSAACIAMEYVDGATLADTRKARENGCLSVSELAPLVEQLCDALHYAHVKAHVIHRDLKPANVMVNSKGELKISDFGIARTVSDSVSMVSRSQGVSGTLAYMSPQQLDGERASISDDIYSLGATLYELLTSKPPFYRGSIDQQIREKQAAAVSERLKEMNITSESVPVAWEATIDACLAKTSAERPANAREVALGLGLRLPRYEVKQSSAHETSQATRQFGRDRGRYRILVCALVIAAVGAIIVFAGHRFRIRPQGAPNEIVAGSRGATSPLHNEPTAEDLLRRGVIAENASHYSEAFDVFTRSAKAGNAEAMYQLSYCYFHGRGATVDLEQATKWMQRAAEGGFVRAEYDFALMLQNGETGVKDEAGALTWYTKAAEAGYAQAQTNLGTMYDRGEGVPKDRARAITWYQKSAEQNEPHAQTNLGQEYRLGEGVTQDYARAAQWYRKAADQGFAPAETYLGELFRDGQGVDRSPAEAATWLSKAAEGGDTRGQIDLAEMFEKGLGVRKDEKRAADLYQKAAAQGDGNAEYNLGRMYAEGRGVSKDLSAARDYFNRAVAHGNDSAAADLQRLGK